MSRSAIDILSHNAVINEHVLALMFARMFIRIVSLHWSFVEGAVFWTWNKILKTNRFILFSEHNLNMDSCYECKKCQFFKWVYSIVKRFLGTFSQRSPFQKDCKSKLSLQSNKYVICFHSKHVVCQKKPWIDVFESTIVKIAKP